MSGAGAAAFTQCMQTYLKGHLRVGGEDAIQSAAERLLQKRHTRHKTQ